MARSLLVPGWGQEHNHAWLKALLVASAEGLLGVRIVQDQRALDGLLRDIDLAKADEAAGLADADPVRVGAAQARRFALTNEYNSRLDQRLGRQWLLGAVVAYAMVDAYVDANFRGFDVEFGKDPALPAGASSTVQPGRATEFRLRPRDEGH